MKACQSPVFDSALAHELLGATARITAVFPEGLPEQADPSQRIVPPMMELNNGPALGRECLLDLAEQDPFMVSPTDQSTEAKQMIDRVREWQSAVINPQEEDVFKTHPAAFRGSIAQGVHRKVTMKDPLEQLGVRQGVIPDSG